MSVSHVRGISKKLYTRFLEDLRRSFSAYPDGTYAIVPTPLMATSLRSDLTAEGISVPRDAITTPGDSAIAFFKKVNPDREILTDIDSQAIIFNILLEDPERFNLFFRAGGSLRQAFVPTIHSFIAMLVDFRKDYPSCLGQLTTDKSSQLSMVLGRYLAYLRDNDLVDPHEVPNLAADMVRHKQVLNPSTLLIYGIYEPLPSMKQFLASLCDSSTAVRYYDFTGSNRAIFSTDQPLEGDLESEEVALDANEMALSRLFLGESTKCDLSEKLCIISYRAPLDELRGVVTQVEDLVLSGVSPSEIAILLPLRAKSAPLLRQVLNEYSIPAYFTYPQGLMESPIVQTIFSIFDTVEHDYRLEDVLRLIGSPNVRFCFGDSKTQGAVNHYEVNRYGQEAGMIDGGDWSEALRYLAASKQSKIGSILVDDSQREQLTRQIEHIEALSSGMDAFVQSLSSLKGEKTVEQHVQSLRSVLERLELGKHYCYTDDELRAKEAYALKSFMALLDEVEHSAKITSEGKISHDNFFSRLRTHSSTRGWGPLGQRTGSVMVGGLRSAALQPFKHVFIVGMVDGDLPSLDPAHPLATEEEIFQMGFLSPRDILRHERYYFLAALASAERSVHLSYSITKDGNPVVPSPFIEDIKASFNIPIVSGGSFCRSRLKLQELVGKGIVGKVDQDSFPAIDLSADLDGICTRIQVEEWHRRGKYHSPYDAVLAGEADIVLKLKDLHFKRVYSPSQLEAYRDCPFRYFMHFVLGLTPDQLTSQDGQPRDNGLVFHRVACRFYNERITSGMGKISPLEAVDALERIRAIAREELMMGDEMTADREAFAIRLMGDQECPGLLGLFIKSEVGNPLPGLQPSLFEKSIGVDRTRGEECASLTNDPVVIELGGGTPSQMLLRCIVDRVDMGPNNTAFVIDYKTGSKVPSASAVRSGDKLQLPLYILALEQALPGIQCIGGGYYIIREGEEMGLIPILGDASHKGLLGELGRKRCISPEYRQILETSKRSCQEIIGGMMKGMFHPTITGKECSSSCDYLSCCRFNEIRLLEMGRM